MMTIYLVPVGRTEFSPNGELLGLNNPSLNSHGISHAERAAEHFRPIVLEAVFSGPLRRQTETAKRIADLHSMPVRTDKDLIDVNFGSWCGMTWSNIEKSEARLFAKFRDSPSKFKFPVGEKMKRGGKRVQSFVSRVMANYGTGNLAIVADDLVIHMLASQMARIEFIRIEPWKPSEGAFTTLECDGGRCAIKSLRGSPWQS